MRQRAFTKKMIAERLVMWRVKLKIRPASSAGRISGSVTLRKVYCASAPRMPEASSMLGSICCKAATPDRTEAGRLRTTNAAMMMNGEPTSASGLPMKQSAAIRANSPPVSIAFATARPRYSGHLRFAIRNHQHGQERVEDRRQRRRGLEEDLDVIGDLEERVAPEAAGDHAAEVRDGLGDEVYPVEHQEIEAHAEQQPGWPRQASHSEQPL